MRTAIVSAMGVAQKIPVTPPKIGTISEKIISSTSLKMDKGAADFACTQLELRLMATRCEYIIKKNIFLFKGHFNQKKAGRLLKWVY